MPKRPKRDLRKKWNRDEEDAIRMDLSIRRGRVDPNRDRRYVLDNDKLWRVLARHGLTTLGPTRLKELGIEPVQMRRLEPPVVKRIEKRSAKAPAWVPPYFAEKVERKRPSRTISAAFLKRLLGAIADPERRALAERDIEEWVIDDREEALFRHARAWRDRTAGIDRPVEPRIPRFDDRDGGLVFEPRGSSNNLARREKELQALGRRVSRVTNGRSQTTIGPFDRLVLMNWRNLSPLLCWEESGFSERHWTELGDDELRQFVEAGDLREQILARRDDDFSRVRRALRERRPPTRNAEPPQADANVDPWDDFDISAAEIQSIASGEAAAVTTSQRKKRPTELAEKRAASRWKRLR